MGVRVRVRSLFSRKNVHSDRRADASQNSSTTINSSRSEIPGSLEPGVSVIATSSRADPMSAEMSISTPDHIRGGLDQTSESMAEAEQQLLLRQLVLMDPRESQQRHQDIHLQGSHKWFLQSSEFKEWQEKDDMLLLITGLPGTGKTMLMTSIINHLESIFTRTDPGILAFHFFELLDSRATNATSMLRSMIYLLVSQQNWLLTHLWEKYKVAGVQLFEGENAFNALSSVFQNILRDPRLQPVYLVVDALDECKEGLSLLLDLIDRTKHDRETRVKWIVSSREYPQIKRWMLDIEGCSHMVLGVSNAYHSNLGLFVDNNVSELTKEKNLSNELQDKIRNFLLKRADTFLYVSMSCNHMKSQTVGGIRHYLQSMQTLENKDLIPNQLSVLYDKIFANIEKAESPEIVRHRLSVISVVAFAYRPLHYLELSMLTDVKGEENESLTLENVWKTCGSILSRRENVVYVVHQSVRDYILHNNVFEEPLVHFNVFSRSLRVLSEVLHRDMYSVQHVGTSYVSAKLQTPNPDPLASIEYSSIFWVKHICDAVSSRSQYKYVLRDHGDVFLFLQKHFLHLLESLSLLGQLSKGIFPLKLLLRVIQETCDPDSQLAEMLIDAERFIRSSSWVIERFPLQTYCAALAFSPNSSSTKQLHWQDRMPLLKDVKGVRDDWDGCLQILEGHRKAVRAISFSPDGKVLASASSDKRVMIWDTSMGTIIRRLEGHSGSVLDVRFSPDNKFIASASSDRTVRIWDSETGAERMFLQKHNGIVRTLRFLPDCTGFVTSSRDNTVLRWDTAAASAEKIYDGEFSDINAAVLSPDGSRIAVALDEKVQVHSFPHGTHERTFAGNAGVVYELEFSPDGRILASSSHDNTIRLWYIKEDREVTLSGHSGAVFAVTFSADSQKLASTSSDRTIRLWDVEKASHVRTFEGHRDWVNAVAFSPDNKIIASCSHDKTVRLWDAKNIAMDVSPRTQSIRTIVFSPDGTKIALVLGNWSVQVWKPAQRVHLASIECESGIITSIAFSPNGKILATVSNDKIVRLYGTDKGDLQIKLDGRERHKRRVNAVAFAADGNLLASASNDKTVKIWNTSSSEAIRTLRGHEDWVTLVAFAPNSNIIASASSDKTVMLWNGTICFRKIKLFSIPGFLQFSEDSIDLNIGRQSMNVETGVPSTRLNGMDSAREMSLVGDWITRGGEKIMWLPSDYRPTCSAFHNEMGVLGQESGRLTILEFKID